MRSKLTLKKIDKPFFYFGENETQKLMSKEIKKEEKKEKNNEFLEPHRKLFNQDISHDKKAIVNTILIAPTKTTFEAYRKLHAPPQHSGVPHMLVCVCYSCSHFSFLVLDLAKKGLKFYLSFQLSP
jgi:hypothetical protein